jgi:hypothetical protein
MVKIILPATVAMAGLLFSVTSAVYAKPEYSKAEKKPCTACHVKTGSKDLNDAGKEWKKKKAIKK